MFWCRSYAEALAALLIDAELAKLPGTDGDLWPVFTSSMPSDPTQAICIYDTGADDEGRIMAGERVIKPTGQIKLRDMRYDLVMSKALEIQNYLDTVKSKTVTVDDKKYTIFSVRIKIIATPIGQDEKNRGQLVVINYKLTPVPYRGED